MKNKSPSMLVAGAMLALCMVGTAVAQNRPGDSTSQLLPEQRRELQQQINERRQAAPAPRRNLQRDDRPDHRHGRKAFRRRTH